MQNLAGPKTPTTIVAIPGMCLTKSVRTFPRREKVKIFKKKSEKDKGFVTVLNCKIETIVPKQIKSNL